MKPAFVFEGRNKIDEDKLENIGFKYYGCGGM
jgi:NifU-like protein involved in Fe-S cluster formation